METEEDCLVAVRQYYFKKIKLPCRRCYSQNTNQGGCTMRIFLLIGCLFLIINTPLNACDPMGETGIVPENDLWIGPNDKSANTITQDEIIIIFQFLSVRFNH